MNIRLEEGFVQEDIYFWFCRVYEFKSMFFLSGTMSSLHIDIEPHTCIDVLDIMTDDDFHVE